MNVYLPLFLLVAFTTDITNALADDMPQRPARSRVWLDRPWEVRYVLFLDSARGFSNAARASHKLNTAPRKAGRERVYFFADELFEPNAMFKVPGQRDPLATVVIQFDHIGQVTTKNSVLSTYTAKRNLLDDLVLIKTNTPEEIPLYFADWSQGIPGDVSFSPAVCAGDDWMRNETDRTDFSSGAFGCREWTAQLYNHERPYIDVTSYASDGSFIGQFVGWSRLTDPPKPVIGLHGKTWLCLHECPVGEKPGIIRNIKAWTSKHGFPMPERPPQQPLYPNSKYKADIEEE